jgi:superfamily II DNA or RNA helicase
MVSKRRGKHLLVYTSSKNPDQMIQAQRILNDLDVTSTRVTQFESRDPVLLKSILNSFQEGDINVLLAKKVLDEGVDIPATKEAILLASSTVSREWIQRRGRVLRKSPGKQFAEIHDFITLPNRETSSGVGRDAVISSEGERVRAFALDATNAQEVILKLEGMFDEYRER